MRECGYNSESSTNSKILKTVDGAAIVQQKNFPQKSQNIRNNTQQNFNQSY